VSRRRLVLHTRRLTSQELPPLSVQVFFQYLFFIKILRRGKRQGRSGSVARKRAGLRCGWMDGWTEKRTRDGSERVKGGDQVTKESYEPWLTTVVEVCFIDHTW
jgi:hypothetical protein